MTDYVRVIDITGKRFGRLLVIRRVENSPRRQARWLCQCDCGNTHIAVSRDLRIGDTTSCGCYVREVVKVASITHGHSRKMTVGTSREYSSWANMIQRCANPASDAAGNYYHKGIRVIRRWFKFENFFADMGECPPGFTIERLDGSKGYSPNNCVWASPKTQANNTNRNKRLTFSGKTKTMAQWSEDARCVVSYTTLRNRLRMGWSVRDALLKPARPSDTRTYESETKTLTEWAQDTRCVVTYEALRGRMRLGWDFHEALTKPDATFGKRRKYTK